LIWSLPVIQEPVIKPPSDLNVSVDVDER